MYKNIIFDFDGTLVNTVGPILLSLKQAFAEHDIFFDETIFNESLFVMPRSEVDKTYQRNVPKDKVDSVLKRYTELQPDKIKTGAFIYPGVENMLKKLKESKKIFIATNSHRDRFQAKFNMLFKENLFDDFRAGVGTKSEMVADLIAMHELDKLQTVMVGDGLGDIAAGHDSGIKTIACGYGYEKDKSALKNASDFYVESVSELSKFLA
ncbi:MAG: HAD family hydrolase [Rickettsiales bacterium]|jgi:phosphoglycolate phosphatase-like HAD superfamily hydrolase|nr:HAD family hydrolase [Rickettsiales bacterium]